MFTYKNIDGVEKHKSIVHYSQTLNTSSLAITSSRIVSGSINNTYWQSLNGLFYTSGSPTLTEIYKSGSSDKYDKFDLPHTNFVSKNLLNPQHINKFHGYSSSSLFSIPQQYYGNSIRRGSFQLTDLNNTNTSGDNPIIKDDGYGNLYSTNAGHSQSAATSISSSDNYVGNIFYDWGLAIITETGSWSGSVDYPDFGINYELKFDSANTIYTTEYTVTSKPTEFNHSMNYTLKCFPGNTTYDSSSFLSEATHMCSEFTSSYFQPYVTQIQLYNENNLDEPVIIAQLPKPVRISDKISNKFVIKLDR